MYYKKNSSDLFHFSIELFFVHLYTQECLPNKWQALWFEEYLLDE